MNDKIRLWARATLLALPFLSCPATVLANDAALDGPAELAVTLPAISVTADKIERPLEKVPVSMAVVDGLSIEHSNITTMDQLEGRVPGLAFQPFGQRGIKSPVMRGLTAALFSFSNSVLMVVDGVPTLMAQGFEHSFLDVDRIEVLRGPQSTLYGRNAEAGVIAIHSRPMDDTPRASVSAEVGSRNKHAVRFATATPLVAGKLYASLSGSWMEQEGFVHNVSKGGMDDDYEHIYVNAGLRWTPTDATDVVLRYTRQDYDDRANPWGSPASPRVNVGSGTPSWNRSEGQTVSLNATHELASRLRLHSITAYNDYQDKILQDSDFGPADLLYISRRNHLRTLSQEFRVEGQWGQTDWLVGVYGERSNNSLGNFTQRYGTFYAYTADWDSEALALFTHWNVPLTDTWSIAAGGRVEYTSVEIEPTGAAQQKSDWTHFSPKLALQYQFSQEHQWYVSVSRGIRAGGYNIFVPALNYPSYAPEENWSYETGLKGFALGQRLRYSLALYYMDIDNMQVMMQPGPGINYIASAATATSQGVEVDVDYLLGHALGGSWQVQGGLAWNQTRFDRFIDGSNDYHDKHNPFSPDLNGHFGLRYQANLGWYAQVGVRASSKMYMDPTNHYRRNGYGLINAALGYQYSNWDISTYLHNAADKTYDATGYQGGTVTIYSPPREFGVRVTWKL